MSVYTKGAVSVEMSISAFSTVDSFTDNLSLLMSGHNSKLRKTPDSEQLMAMFTGISSSAYCLISLHFDTIYLFT